MCFKLNFSCVEQFLEVYSYQFFSSIIGKIKIHKYVCINMPTFLPNQFLIEIKVENIHTYTITMFFVVNKFSIQTFYMCFLIFFCTT